MSYALTFMTISEDWRQLSLSLSASPTSETSMIYMITQEPVTNITDIGPAKSSVRTDCRSSTAELDYTDNTSMQSHLPSEIMDQCSRTTLRLWTNQDFLLWNNTVVLPLTRFWDLVRTQSNLPAYEKYQQIQFPSEISDQRSQILRLWARTVEPPSLRIWTSEVKLVDNVIICFRPVSAAPLA